ncbi:MAG: glycosyltransferase [Acidobacteria bacterium]|nr:glycosyltransferase [Acidobacteriota bacterium]
MSMSKLSGDSEWALLLAPESPYPMAGGGAIRTASLVCYLASRFRLHLVVFHAGMDTPDAGRFPAGGVEKLDWVSLAPHSKTAVARASRNLWRLLRGVPPLSDRFTGPSSREQVARAIAGRRYRVAIVEHFWCATYEELLRPRAEHVVMDLHNIESTLHARCAATEAIPGRWAHAAFARMAMRAERQWLPRFDLVLAASEADRQRVKDLAPGVRAGVYPNAIPRRFPEPAEEEHCVAFSGNLEYHPNAAAVRYFARDVWPALRQQDPQLRWRLIGKNDWAVRRWTAGDPRIETTGPIDDPLAELARVRVVVVPLLSGSGTRIKILEAWAAGRAVVSTSVGAEGLPAKDGENLLLADSPDRMCQAVLALLRDPGERRRLGQAGRRLVEQQFCWPVAFRVLDESLAGFQRTGRIGVSL